MSTRTRHVLCGLLLLACEVNSTNHEKCMEKHEKEERQHEEDCAHYGYSGYGGYLDPTVWCAKSCVEAPDESPIDIETDKTEHGDDDQCEDELDWDVKEDHELWQVTNNCHTLQVTPMGFEDGKFTPYNHDRFNVARLKMEDTPFEHDDDHHEEYCLSQFHFHWGADSSIGSEHRVNGHQFPLEVHFVHYACEYGDFDHAQAEGNLSAYEHTGDADHTLAVVAFFFDVTSEDNPGFEAILGENVFKDVEHCAGHCTDGTGSTYIKNDAVLRHIIPNDIENGGYWAYKGSLTTPPCTDDVNWFIMKKRGTISERQMQRFRSLKDEDGKPILRNWREIQEKENPVFDCGDNEENEESEREIEIEKIESQRRGSTT
eukprot:261203_1